MLVAIVFLFLLLFAVSCAYHVDVSFETPYGDVGPSTGAYLIVEPREHPLLRHVIAQFSTRVPSDWTLYVAHGTTNAEFARQAARDAVAAGRRVVFIPLDTTNLRPQDYNILFKKTHFWDAIDAEHILVFQTDSVPCGPMLDMDRFGKFGYIGCAYGNEAGNDTGYWGADNAFYGVGGLSLRRKSFMLNCLRSTPCHHEEAEDVTFSNCVEKLASTYPRPTAQDIGDFCAQTGWGDPSNPPRSWGAHQVTGMDPTRRTVFFEHCPAAKVLI